MLRTLFLCVVFFSLAISLFAVDTSSGSAFFDKVHTDYDCKYAQCEAIAKSTRKRCKHCVSNDGDLYCWQHR